VWRDSGLLSINVYLSDKVTELEGYEVKQRQSKDGQRWEECYLPGIYLFREKGRKLEEIRDVYHFLLQFQNSFEFQTTKKEHVPNYRPLLNKSPDRDASAGESPNPAMAGPLKSWYLAAENNNRFIQRVIFFCKSLWTLKFFMIQ